jgi:tetratricopeptide (TPR) repeat protein
LPTLETIDRTAKQSLKDLCDAVLSFNAAYDDVVDEVEDLAYFEYGHGDMDDAIEQLKRLAHFFERLRNKNEEVCRDLAQVYLLIGQIYQYAGKFEESIEWINKSIVVDDMYSVPYHSLAVSFQSLGDESAAIKCPEQEIKVEPGNYYTYLLPADLYEKNEKYDRFESIIRRLLERDPQNVRGLHRLIRYYERNPSNTDAELLRRKLLNHADGLCRIESIIHAYHLLHTKRSREAIEFLANWGQNSPDVSIIHLANAHIHAHTHQYSKMRYELSCFKRKNHGREDVMEIKIIEFASVFGNSAAERLRQKLKVVYPINI